MQGTSVRSGRSTMPGALEEGRAPSGPGDSDSTGQASLGRSSTSSTSGDSSNLVVELVLDNPRCAERGPSAIRPRGFKQHRARQPGTVEHELDQRCPGELGVEKELDNLT